MKARTLVSICLIAGAAAWAQTTPPSQKVAENKAAAKPAVQAPAAKPAPGKPAATTAAAPAKPAAKPAATTAAAPAKPAVKPAAPAPTAKPVAKAAPQAATKTTATKAAAKKPAAKKPAAAVTKAVLKAPAVKPERKVAVAGKRDPFVSPIRESGGATGPTCTTGKKCLAIDTVDLKGIVRMQQGMIAVVESSTRKVTFFLRENDPVFNGYVMKITLDSIVFRENVVDKAGNQSTRDVVKRVVAPAV